MEEFVSILLSTIQCHHLELEGKDQHRNMNDILMDLMQNNAMG